MAQNCARTCGTCAGVNTTVSVVEELEVINGLAVLPTSDVFTMTIRCVLGRRIHHSQHSQSYHIV